MADKIRREDLLAQSLEDLGRQWANRPYEPIGATFALIARARELGIELVPMCVSMVVSQRFGNEEKLYPVAFLGEKVFHLFRREGAIERKIFSLPPTGFREGYMVALNPEARVLFDVALGQVRHHPAMQRFGRTSFWGDLTQFDGVVPAVKGTMIPHRADFVLDDDYVVSYFFYEPTQVPTGEDRKPIDLSKRVVATPSPFHRPGNGFGLADTPAGQHTLRRA